MYAFAKHEERIIMKVRDFMITRVFTVKPTNTVEELLNILNTNRISC